MSMKEIIELCLEHGMGAVAIGAGIWMLWYLVKHTVTELSKTIERLNTKIDTFTIHVRNEHKQSVEQHKQLMKEHDEMIQTLGRINGWKNDH